MATDLRAPKGVERIRAFLGTHELAIEKWYPAAIAILASIPASFLTTDVASYLAICTSVLPVFISIAAILAGFQATAQTIVLAVIGSTTIQFLRRVGKFTLLVDYLWTSICSLMLFILIALAILCLAHLKCALWQGTSTMVLCASFAYAMAASFRIMHLIIKLLRITPDD